MKAKVSIIVPVYNAEQYLEECIDSILNQSLRDIEIIIVNDGSTDGSADIIEKYKKSDSRIVYLAQENQGLALARAHGFKLATTEYIGWVDSDDFIEPQMFETLYTAAIKNNSDLVSCNYSFYPQKISGKEKWFKEYKGVKDWRFIERNSNAWNKVIRRDLCDEIDFYNTLVEFSDSVYVKALLHCKNPITINEELYHYRVGQLSMSYGFSGKTEHFKRVANTALKQKVFLNGLDSTLYKELEEYFDYRYIYALLQLLVVSAYNEDKALYKSTVSTLKRINYRKNKLTAVILRENHGSGKAFVWKNITPISYTLTKIMSRMIWGKQKNA